MIAEAVLAVDDAVAAEALRVLRRDRVRNLVRESDRLLGRLEALNLREAQMTTDRLRPRLIRLFRVVLGETLNDRHQVIWRTQSALEHVYDAQDVLLDVLHPERARLRRLDTPEKED